MAGSTSIPAHLHFDVLADTNDFEGALGTWSFDENGDITGRGADAERHYRSERRADDQHCRR